jgi:hypothetical protein
MAEAAKTYPKGASYSWGVYARYMDGGIFKLEHFTDFAAESLADSIVKRLSDGQYTIADASMCVWEYVLDNARNSKIEAWRNTNGAAECRAQSYRLAIQLEQVWCRLSDDAQSGVGSFDWEFVPLIFSRFVKLDSTLELAKPIHEIAKEVESMFCV